MNTTGDSTGSNTESENVENVPVSSVEKSVENTQNLPPSGVSPSVPSTDVVVSSSTPSSAPSALQESSSEDDEKVPSFTEKERKDIFFSVLLEMLKDIKEAYNDEGALSFYVFLSEEKKLKEKKKRTVTLFNTFFENNKDSIASRDISTFYQKKVSFSDRSYIDFEKILSQEPTSENPIYDYIITMERILNFKDKSPATMKFLQAQKEATNKGVNLNELGEIANGIMNEFKDVKEFNLPILLNKVASSRNVKKLVNTVSSIFGGDNNSGQNFDLNSLVGMLGNLGNRNTSK